MKQYESQIKRLLFIMLNGCYEDIEDVSQNILFALYQSLSKFKFQSSFKTYLYRFVKNKAIDYIRKQTKWKRGEEQLSQKDEKLFINPEDQFMMKETENEFYNFLFQLNEEKRIILYLKNIEGKSINEIAEKKKKKTGTIKSNLHRT
ncbi:MAG: sigma-70 family RNA polymerase sigma factor, partial [Spirochaetes bacterium]|nr:sigma-70 family RNA polymerase sigma factor [Spirochaetota bacterium]